MKVQNIQFVEVNDGKLTVFSSALQKDSFLQTHKAGTFCMIGSNAAAEKLYILIDTDGIGFVLNKTALTYNECINLINHYL